MAEIRRSLERRQRNLVAGVSIGVAAGALLGAAAGIALPGITAVGGALLGALVGIIVGTLLGKMIGGRVLSQLPEPLASERSYVGARTPDDPGDTGSPSPGSRRR